jgi:hypothetical protein
MKMNPIKRKAAPIATNARCPEYPIARKTTPMAKNAIAPAIDLFTTARPSLDVAERFTAQRRAQARPLKPCVRRHLGTDRTLTPCQTPATPPALSRNPEKDHGGNE